MTGKSGALYSPVGTPVSEELGESGQRELKMMGILKEGGGFFPLCTRLAE